MKGRAVRGVARDGDDEVEGDVDENEDGSWVKSQSGHVAYYNVPAQLVQNHVSIHPPPTLIEHNKEGAARQDEEEAQTGQHCEEHLPPSLLLQCLQPLKSLQRGGVVPLFKYVIQSGDVSRDVAKVGDEREGDNRQASGGKYNHLAYAHLSNGRAWQDAHIEKGGDETDATPPKWRHGRTEVALPQAEASRAVVHAHADKVRSGALVKVGEVWIDTCVHQIYAQAQNGKQDEATNSSHSHANHC
mmetsp:Transcript_4585/g.9506  ORF Transcript_4585/g.9506 Transcript_4585/m.9506 type:complete len:244 (-) Transcript_4585:633-1364(-)